MKQLLLLIAAIIPLAAAAQSTRSKKKISIGFTVSPSYGFRTLKNNDGSSSSDIVINSRNDAEQGRFTYNAGANVLFNFSDRMGIETGILYSNRGYKTKNLDLTYTMPDPSLPTKARFVYSYKYFGIPLKARFTAGKNKLRFLGSFGLVTNFLLTVKQTSKYEYTGGRTDEHKQATSSGFKKIDISPTLSAGIDYKLNNKVHLIVAPTFEYGLLKIRDAPVVEHLWNAGMALGFYYGLR